MTLDPLEFDLAACQCGVEEFEEVPIEDFLPVGLLPALAFPPGHPFGQGVDHVLGVAEDLELLIGIGGGLGFFTLNASTSFDYTGLWSGIIALGVVGYILNKLFALVERRLIAWHYGLMAHSQGGN